MVCGGMTGRLEVAHELIKLLNLENEVNIEEVSTDFFAKEYFAERPPNERLINRRLNDLNLNKMRDWKVALSDYIKSSYSDYIKS
jgi:dTDP-4-dehydrorhamnose reductase